MALRSSCQRRCSSSMRARRASRASCHVANEPPCTHAVPPSRVTIRWRHPCEELPVVADEEDRLGTGAQRRLEPLLARHVEVVVRLVEQEDVGVRPQQHLDGEPLLLAARQRGQRPVAGHGERLADRDGAARVPQDLRVPPTRVAPHGVGSTERHARCDRWGRASTAASARASWAAACWRRSGDRSSSMSRTVRPSSRQPTSWRMTRNRPSTCTLPSSADWSPAMTRNKVVLPTPLAPTSDTCSPSPTPKLTSCSSSTPPGVRHATPFTSIAPTAPTLPTRPAGWSEVCPARPRSRAQRCGAGSQLAPPVAATSNWGAKCGRNDGSPSG